MSENRKSALTLASLWLLMFASSSQFFIMAPILPQIGRQLHVPGNLQGTLISVYALALGITALFAGPVSDRIGRRKMLLLGSATMFASLAMHMFAFNYTSILIIRLITGISGGLLTGTCVSYVRDFYPYAKRGFANGIIATGGAFGQIVAIPIGILISERFGFYSPFQLFAVVMFVALAMIYFFIDQPVLDIKQSAEPEKKKILKGYLDILKYSTNRATAVGYVLMFFSITIYIVFFPTWMMEVNHFSSGQVALLFLIGGIATLTGGPLIGRMTDRLGRKPVAIFVNMGLILALLLSMSFSTHILPAATFFFLVMLFISGRLVSFQSLAADISKDSNRGQFMSLMISIGQIGMILGSSISGFIYCTKGFETNSILAIVSSIAMIGVVWNFIPEGPLDKEKKEKRVVLFDFLND